MGEIKNGLIAAVECAFYKLTTDLTQVGKNCKIGPEKPHGECPITSHQHQHSDDPLADKEWTSNYQKSVNVDKKLDDEDFRTDNCFLFCFFRAKASM